MKGRLNALRARLDAMSVRERVMLFAAAVALVTFFLYSVVLGPLLARQAELRARILQQQDNIAGIDAEITAQVQAYQVDPDKDTRAHLAALHANTAELGASLRAMQNGLVEPERMAPLLETMLKANGRLQLVGLKTLPVTVMNGQPPAAAPADLQALQPGMTNLARPPAPGAPAPAAPPAALLYRHGVEVTVRGNYLDMVDYLTTLESMPARLFWGSAELTVEQYPNSRLRLTVYTLSLDEKWMKL